jgi:hypothetical protein
MKKSTRLIFASASVLATSILPCLPASTAAAPLRTGQSQTPEASTTPPPAAAAQGAAGAGPSEADANEYKNYRLNMNNVEKYVTATKGILKLMSENPTLKKQFESQRDVSTIDEAVKTTEKYPEVTGSIESAGLTTRDYVVISGTLTGAMMAVDMRKQGQIKSYPNTLLPENLTFVEKNYDKLKSMMKALQAQADQD